MRVKKTCHKYPSSHRVIANANCQGHKSILKGSGNSAPCILILKEQVRLEGVLHTKQQFRKEAHGPLHKKKVNMAAVDHKVLANMQWRQGRRQRPDLEERYGQNLELVLRGTESLLFNNGVGSSFQLNCGDWIRIASTTADRTAEIVGTSRPTQLVTLLFLLVTIVARGLSFTTHDKKPWNGSLARQSGELVTFFIDGQNILRVGTI